VLFRTLVPVSAAMALFSTPPTSRDSDVSSSTTLRKLFGTFYYIILRCQCHCICFFHTYVCFDNILFSIVYQDSNRLLSYQYASRYNLAAVCVCFLFVVLYNILIMCAYIHDSSSPFLNALTRVKNIQL
jgi:hypothetical protein